MLLIVWISIPFPNDLLWWEQFIAILSLKSVTCEVCRLAASLQNRTLPEINSLSYMPHVALYELFMDCFHEWHLYLLHGLKQKYADVSAYRRSGLFSAGFLSRDVVGLHVYLCLFFMTDSLVLDLQFVYDGYLSGGSRQHDPHANAAKRLCALQ